VSAAASGRRRGGYLLYGSRNSGSAAVEAALEIAGAPYRIVDAATWRRRDDPKTFAQLERANPLHQVPTLVCPDGTTVLSESAAILVHLALAHPRARLLPADAARRAQALRAMVFVVANCYAAIGVIDYPERWVGRGDKAASERLHKGARRRLHAMWRVFADTFVDDAAAKGQRFLFGAQRPSAADLLATVVSRWSGARAHLARHRPVLHALVERVEAHPSVAAVFERHWGAGPVAGP
jgi:GST-like protein